MAYKGHEWTDVFDPSNPGSALPLSAERLNEMELGIENAIDRNGDTMTGDLKLNGNSPESDSSAVSKGYVDGVIKYYSVDYTITANSQNTPICTIENFNPEKQLILLYRYFRDSLTLYKDYSGWIPLSPINGSDFVEYDSNSRYDIYVKVSSDGNFYIYGDDDKALSQSGTVRFLLMPIERVNI